MNIRLGHGFYCDEAKFRVFKNNNLWKINISPGSENEEDQIRHNLDLQYCCNQPDFFKTLKSHRLRWVGYFTQMRRIMSSSNKVEGENTRFGWRRIQIKKTASFMVDLTYFEVKSHRVKYAGWESRELFLGFLRNKHLESSRWVDSTDHGVCDLKGTWKKQSTYKSGYKRMFDVALGSRVPDKTS